MAYRRPDQAVESFETLARHYEIARRDTLWMLPYFAEVIAASDGHEALSHYLEAFTPRARGFDWHLAQSFLAARMGDMDRVLVHLEAALDKRPHTEERPVLTGYQWAQACEALLALTKDDRLRASLLEWSRRMQRIEPYLAWPYAIEAQYTLDEHARDIALGMSMRLDPGSPRYTASAPRTKNEHHAASPHRIHSTHHDRCPAGTEPDAGHVPAKFPSVYVGKGSGICLGKSANCHPIAVGEISKLSPYSLSPYSDSALAHFVAPLRERKPQVMRAFKARPRGAARRGLAGRARARARIPAGNLAAPRSLGGLRRRAGTNRGEEGLAQRCQGGSPSSPARDAAPPRARCLPGPLPEGARETLGIVEADRVGDLYHRPVGPRQQLTGARLARGILQTLQTRPRRPQLAMEGTLRHTQPGRKEGGVAQFPGAGEQFARAAHEQAIATVLVHRQRQGTLQHLVQGGLVADQREIEYRASKLKPAWSAAKSPARIHQRVDRRMRRRWERKRTLLRGMRESTAQHAKPCT